MRFYSGEYFSLVCIRTLLPRHLWLATTKDGKPSGIGTQHWSDMVWLSPCWANTQDSCSQAIWIGPTTDVPLHALPCCPLSSPTPGKGDHAGTLRRPYPRLRHTTQHKITPLPRYLGLKLRSHLGSKDPRNCPVSNGTRSLSVQWAISHTISAFFKYM